jgi:hypothetical protein
MSSPIDLTRASTPIAAQQLQDVLDDIESDIYGYGTSDDEEYDSSDDESEPNAIPDLHNVNRGIKDLDALRLAAGYCNICRAFDEEIAHVQGMVPIDGHHYLDVRERLNNHIREHDGLMAVSALSTLEPTKDDGVEKIASTVVQVENGDGGDVNDFFDFDMYEGDAAVQTQTEKPARRRRRKVRGLKKWGSTG